MLGMFTIVLLLLDFSDTQLKDFYELILGLSFILDVAMIFTGFVLGLLVLRKSISNKWMAITGVCINGVFIILGIIVFIIGSLG